MLHSRLLFFALLLYLPLVAPAVDDAGAEGGLVLRDAEVYLKPDRTSAVVTRLSAGDTVDLLGRQGLWILLAADERHASGWIRLTALRLTGASTRAAAAPGSDGIGGGFARLSRSIGGFFGGFRRRNAPQRAGTTIGVRGLTAAELQTAQYDAAAWDAVVAAAATAVSAEAFAAAGGLAARSVSPTIASGAQ